MPYQGDPGSSTLSQVRFLVGDTDNTDELLNDREYQFLLTEHTNPYLAAAAAAEAIAGKVARDVSHSMEGSSLSASDRFRHFKELASNLRGLARDSGTLQFIVNDGLAEVHIAAADAVLTEPIFSVGMHDNTEST